MYLNTGAAFVVAKLSFVVIVKNWFMLQYPVLVLYWTFICICF